MVQSEPYDMDTSSLNTRMKLGSCSGILGHLSKSSVERLTTGSTFQKGDLLAWVGNKSKMEDGIHISTFNSTVRPETHDLSSVVSKKNLTALSATQTLETFWEMCIHEDDHAPARLFLAVGSTQCCGDFVGIHFGVCTQDDAFISFRYAENWANGLGWVFNVDEYVRFFNPL